MILVKLYGQPVGVLMEDGPSILFEYTPEFLQTGLEPSPFMLPADNQVHRFLNRGDSFKGLPHFISDALPDKFGHAVIDTYFAKQGRAVNSVSILEKLAYVGSKAIGALEFEPAAANPKDAYTNILDVRRLVDASRHAIKGEFSEVVDDILSIGSSAGGARAKALIGYDAINQKMVAGQYQVPDGYIYSLIKFDGIDQNNPQADPLGYTNIEYAYHLLAKAYGITMTDSFLLADGSRHHFITERFDRTDQGKVHTQTLCALIGSDFENYQYSSYSDYFNVGIQMDLSYRERLEMFKRMVFNVFLVNRDDHSKNFSFLMNPDGQWRLAPAYDITHAFNENNPNAWTREHNLLINGKGRFITKTDLMQEAKTLRLKDKDMEEELKQITEAILPQFTAVAENDAGVTKARQTKIIERIHRQKAGAL